MDLKRNDLLVEQNYINGQWIDAPDGRSIEVTNPATQKTIGNVPNLDASTVETAIIAAEKAQHHWKALTAKERSTILMRWYDLIIQYQVDLAIIMTSEQGKPLKEAQGEILYAASFVQWFAEEGRRVLGDVLTSPKPHQRMMVIKQPIGVVAAITPWNFPSAMITRKVAPALAVGCTAIVKPAAETPFSALALAKLAEEAGIPAGVLNIVTGEAAPIGELFTSHPAIRKISFTGSTAVGKKLLKQSASTVKNVSLELGGNAPFIIFDDAKLDKAIEGAIASKFRNSGQTCVCANRIYVHERIMDRFMPKFLEAVKKLRPGNGLEETSTQGPLINQAAVEKLERLLKDAKAKGANIELGGKPSALGGTFFEPTVVTDVTEEMDLIKEEIFGPIAPIIPFSTEEEVVLKANATNAGLSAYFFTQDPSRIWRVSEALEYGMVGANEPLISSEVAPFGGVKESGLGREASYAGIEAYIEMKYICVGIELH